MVAQDLGSTDTDGALCAYWDGFSLFSSRWQMAVYSRPLLFVGIPLLPFVLYVAVSVGADLHFRNSDLPWTRSSLREWQEIVATAGVITVAWSFSRLRRVIPKVLRWLYDSGRVSCRARDSGKAWLGFLESYQAELQRPAGRYAFVVLLLVFGLILNVIAGKPGQVWDYWKRAAAGDGLRATILIIIWMFGFSLWAVFGGLMLRPIRVTGKYMVALADRFEVSVHPSHPDHCGGLSPLGDLGFALVLPVVLIGAFLALFGLSPVLLPDFAVGDVAVSQIMGETALLSNVGLFVFALPIAVMVFFLPMWRIHRYMAACRREVGDEFTGMVMNLQEQIRVCIGAPDGVDEAVVLREKLEILQATHASQTNYPVWPFRLPMLLTVLSPQILSVAVSAVFDVREIVLALLD